MNATVDFTKFRELNPELANSKTQRKVDLAMKRGTYLVAIVDKDTGDVLYPSVPAHSALEIVRTLNS